MKTARWVVVLFYLAALWDGILGLVFLIAADGLYARFHVTPANHPGYVQFPALLLITFGLLFLAVARNPVANRNLIPFGMMLKVSYCAVILYHWFRTGLPDMWKPFAAVDLVFLIGFVVAYRAIPKRKAAGAVA